jgi:hypothetical protein
MSFLDYIRNFLNNNKKNVRLITKDLVKIQGDKTPFEVALFDEKTPYTNQEINIKINGVTYKRETDNDGIAKLNINLPVGEYEPVISFENAESNYVSTTCNIIINPILNSQDLIMIAGDGNKFNVSLKDYAGNNITGCNVKFTINGKTYSRETDGNGIAGLNINLGAGEYKIKTSVGNIVRENTITIKEQPAKETRMEGTDVNKNYGDDTGYQCAVYSDEGRVKGNVKISINGKSYNKTPDEEGLYKLNLNLAPGSYILNAEYQGNVKYKPSSVTNNIIINEKPVPSTKSYEEELLEYFESIFGEVNSIDESLEKILSRGYAYYYDDVYGNYESIDRIANGDGVNCTDACQVFYNIAKALGYTVRCVHVGCSGGDGHVRLQLKHDVNTGGEWINRDPAAVLSDNGQDVSYNWCLNGSIWAYDPDWFMENLYR